MLPRAVLESMPSSRRTDVDAIAGQRRAAPPRIPKSEYKPLILEAAANIGEASRFDYTPDQYVDCQEIRARAGRWVEEARRRKFIGRLQAGLLDPI